MIQQTILDIFACFFVAFGLFFMFVGALGTVRFPDAYNRLHAATKCTTLGLAGLVLGAVFHIGTAAVVAKAAMIILFAFVATPVGSHILAKAAHIDRMKQWPKTLSDELAEDIPARRPRNAAELRAAGNAVGEPGVGYRPRGPMPAAADKDDAPPEEREPAAEDDAAPDAAPASHRDNHTAHAQDHTASGPGRPTRSKQRHDAPAPADRSNEDGTPDRGSGRVMVG